MNTKMILGAAVAALSLGAVASAAHAVEYVIVPGSGYDGVASGKSGVGNSGTDAFGNPWRWNTTTGPKGSLSPGAGYSAWGTPGLKKGLAVYEGSEPADAFFVSFVINHSGATFNQTPSPIVGGTDEWTRFNVCTSQGCVAWTPVFLDDGNEVDFYAPAGQSLTDGEHYFVNVIFNQKTLSGKNIGFSADFATMVPEPGSWALMILGVSAVGGAMRGRRRLAVA